MAYADFVTAMMALFMVLWICSQDKKILLATSKYFKQPFNAVAANSSGVMAEGAGGPRSDDMTAASAAAANLAFLKSLASELNRMVNVDEAEDEKPIEMQITSDGLKITLYDRARHAIFKKGTAEITDWGRFMLQNLAWIIDRNELKVYLEGHAASGKVDGRAESEYGLWELTADRANAARRLLVKFAVNPRKIERVTGFADSKPLPKTAPDSASNERITVSLSPRR